MINNHRNTVKWNYRGKKFIGEQKMTLTPFLPFLKRDRI